MNFKIKTEQGSTYLELPCREEKIAEFCKAVGIPNTSATEVAVEGVYPVQRIELLYANAVGIEFGREKDWAIEHRRNCSRNISIRFTRPRLANILF